MGSSASVTQDLMDERDFEFLLGQYVEVTNAFGAPSILFLPESDLSGAARYRPVKDEVLKALDLSRRHRKEDGYLFSALHLERFFYRALLHVCRTTEEPFEFIQSVRRNFRTRVHVEQLSAFLDLAGSRTWDDRAEFIASTILLDSYIPGEHFFSPAAVFDSLYRAPCQNALVALGLPSTDCQLIEYHLARFYQRLLFGQGPPRRIRESVLSQWRDLLSNTYTNRTCLACLTGPPQHVLRCGHAYCDACVVAYGQLIEDAEYKYLIGQCVLCQTDCNNLIQILPPTACVRAVTVDGGGVRAFIPLRFLCYMQERLGKECPIQELFDVAFGTSSGGFAVLKLFHQRQTVEDCVHALSDMMWRFLRQHPPPRSAWAKVSRALHCWWTDGWYSASAWDKLLQQQFDPDQDMFGVQPVSGIKVAVTTTAAHPVLLTNYRRAPDAADDGERVYYHVHEPTNNAEEPKLWQCARATTAAPVFFPPIEIQGVGSCEDGGLKYNNPAPVCRSELQFMWSSRSEPGIMVSLGTGSAALDRLPATSHHRDRRRRWPSGFAFRLYDSLMASMDAEQAWRGLLGQVEETARQNYRRLNVEFPGKEPSLNAVEKVQWMTNLADNKAKVEVPAVLTSLLLASLFFELSCAPRWVDGHYHCSGTIRCRLPGQTLVEALRGLHPEASASTYVMGMDRLGISPYDEAVCRRCTRYCVPIHFVVRELDSPIVLSLQLTRTHRENLGGFPLTLRWFLDQQGLDAVGHTSSLPRLPAHTGCKSCDARVQRKSALQPHSRHKRRVRFI
ncbi:patatin-like phospholipase family protein [Aspergillus melleus]|uniref:patatin-like phospholipase family protein n=1 Tax=Aspergillus melleus TaxID=138277 RepID=UPI001E8CC0D4|nr:uncharacterized protein LDX57_009335 [Aspergillus melleus]KAH8431681.1 hypothetical protein LDX57_009335 [Aspergillus melleus]